METINQEFIDFTKQLQDWHANRVKQLQLITENRTADLRLGDREISAGSEIAKGIRLGVLLSLDQLGKLPFSVTPCKIEEEEV